LIRIDPSIVFTHLYVLLDLCRYVEELLGYAPNIYTCPTETPSGATIIKIKSMQLTEVRAQHNQTKPLIALIDGLPKQMKDLQFLLQLQ
jgi:hypothetical protein